MKNIVALDNRHPRIFQALDGKTISMKIGDEKRVELQKDGSSYSIDLTDDFELSSSDESVIHIEKRYWSEDIDIVACFLLKANKSGAAVITCVNDWAGETVSFTVEVKGATAKQKACSKHVWKTTKKASCRRAGVKTCKKCKLTKSIPQKQHQWKTYKSLKKKWGKPQKETNDRSTTYSWKKGKTSINYFDYTNAQMLEVDINDKNGKIFGLKVGMKKDAALKSLKETYGVKESDITSAGYEGVEALHIPVPSMAAWVYFENGKVSGMYYQAPVK